MNRTALAVAFGCVLIVTTLWISHAGAQQPATPQTIFTGKTTRLDPPEFNVSKARIRFEAGSRTWWHSHQYGQVMIVEEGRARYQNKGEPVRELRKGESAYTRPDVLHWHGAAPNEALTQMSVAVGGAKWAGEVSDAEYLAKVTPVR